MSFLRQLGQRLLAFMSGRNGLDSLALVLLILSLAVQMVGSIAGSGLLLLVSLVFYGGALFRIFSRKSYRREAENQKFLAGWDKIKVSARQFFLRIKLSRQYKYFRCPQCRALLRMRRGEGEKEICCPQCRHPFRQKA